MHIEFDKTNWCPIYLLIFWMEIHVLSLSSSLHIPRVRVSLRIECARFSASSLLFNFVCDLCSNDVKFNLTKNRAPKPVSCYCCSFFLQNTRLCVCSIFSSCSVFFFLLFQNQEIYISFPFFLLFLFMFFHFF